MRWSVLLLVSLFRVCYLEEYCSVPEKLKREIMSYQNLVDRIIEEATLGSYKGVFYNSLAEFADKYGSRVTGSKALELSIQYLTKLVRSQNLSSVLDPVEVPIWLRGKESAHIITPYRKKSIKIRSLGFSPSGEITGDLIVIQNFKELQEMKEAIPGKVVLFNAKYTDYFHTVTYRLMGPSRASALGATGVLVRSTTPFSIKSIHVGTTEFSQDIKPILSAAITLEDADILDRLYRSKVSVKIHMKMNHKQKLKGYMSYNLIADIPGVQQPESYVVVSAHIDSWDIGEGVLDNAAGAFLALHSMFLQKHLKLTPPRRTFRAILWTAEEQGMLGAKAYAKARKHEIENWSAAFESDAGLYEPLGLSFVGSTPAKCLISEIASMFHKLNVTQVKKSTFTATDLTVFESEGVPVLEPLMVENNYFWFHHSEGDSMRTLNSSHMDRHLALVTGTAYILANLSIPLPRIKN